MVGAETDKQRRQRDLDHLAFNVLVGRYTGPESWMRWTDWFELTKATRSSGKLGDDTFCQTVRRLLSQGRVRRSPQIAKNRFYQPIFPSGSSSEVVSSEDGNGGDAAASAPDKAAQALAFLLNRKAPSVV